MAEIWKDITGFEGRYQVSNYAGNHLHAVANGLNTQAIRVVDPATGRCFDSISQAARGARKAHRTVRATFIRSAAR